MQDLYTLVGLCVFGSIAIISGIISVTKREITFTFRRGTRTPFSIGRLSGNRAVIYGICAIIGGGLLFASAIYAAAPAKLADGKLYRILSAIGVAMFIMGFGFSGFLEYLNYLCVRAKTTSKSTEFPPDSDQVL